MRFCITLSRHNGRDFSTKFFGLKQFLPVRVVRREENTRFQISHEEVGSMTREVTQHVGAFFFQSFADSIARVTRIGAMQGKNKGGESFKIRQIVEIVHHVEWGTEIVGRTSYTQQVIAIKPWWALIFEVAEINPARFGPQTEGHCFSYTGRASAQREVENQNSWHGNMQVEVLCRNILLVVLLAWLSYL